MSKKEESSENNLFEKRENQLRVLHELLPEALRIKDFGVQYVHFLRTLREKNHPLGKKDLRLVELGNGVKCNVDVSDRLGCDIFYGFFNEVFDSYIFLNLINPGDVVIDVGANFGYYSMFAGKKVGTAGKIYSFEPNPDAFQMLKSNVKLNRLGKRVSCHSMCLGNYNGEVEFHITSESSFSSIIDTERSKPKKNITLPIKSIDTFVKQSNIQIVNAIKIDVEGTEYAVLEGAFDTIKRSESPIVMFEVSRKNIDSERKENLNRVLDKFQNIGMTGWYADQRKIRLNKLKPLSSATNVKSHNIIMVKEDSKAEDILSEIGELIIENLQDLSIKGAQPDESAKSAPQQNTFKDENLDKIFLYQSINKLCEELVNIKLISDEKISDLKQILSNSLDDSEDRLKILHKLAEEVETLRLENKTHLGTIEKRDSELAEIRKENEKLTAALEKIKERISDLSKEVGN